jgi:hypothetical protein
MGLSKDLRALGAALGPEEEQWGDADLPQISLCPRLKTVYSPRMSWVEWKGFGEARRPSMPEWARVWDYGPPAAALGLSLAQRSKKGPREGLKGLPSAGRKQVWRALALLEDKRRVLSFWTVSLPTDALTALGRLDAWPLFQDRVRKELARKIQAAGLPALLVGVAELQPKRSLAAGFPCPHLHLVFQGRRSPSHHWALSPADLDGVIRAALATAGVHAPDGTKAEEWLATAGNVQQVKRSVRAYLSKYMTKGSGDTARWVGTEAETLLPRRWWFWTRPLRAWVIEHVFPLAFGFVSWVHANREGLEQMGLARFRVLPLDDPRAPLTFEVSWLSCVHLGQLVYLWQTDQWDDEWHRRYRLDQASSHQWLP